MILRVHLVPAFGRKRLDAIKSEDVQRLKAQLEISRQDGEQHPDRAEHAAEEGGGVGRDRADAVHGSSCCPSKGRAAFHDFDEYSDSSTSHGQSISGRT